MNESFYVFLVLLGMLIASVSQLILKKAAMRSYPKWYLQYLNFAVIFGYSLMLLSTVCNLFAFRGLSLSTSPIWNACGQLFTVVLSAIFLKEKVSLRKGISLAIIICGILIFVWQ